MIDPFLLPLLALVLVTFIVAGLMYSRRINTMKTERIHPQKVYNRAAMAEYLKDTRASDNYLNLFESPILFYLAIFTIILTSKQTPPLLILCWIYVAFRAVHSFIHCSYNKVYHRFIAFILSILTLAAIWLILAVQLLF